MADNIDGSGSES